MLIAQRLAVLASWTLGVALVLVLLDSVFRWPGAFRALLLAGGLAALAVAAYRYLWPAMRFNPTLVQMALRVERIVPGLADRFASSVEFATSGTDESNAMAARAVREMQDDLPPGGVRGVLRTRPTMRDATLAAAVVLIVAAGAMANPDAARTGAARLFLPFSEAAWPARTGIASQMQDVIGEQAVHPRGQALALRAAVTRGADDQPVEAHYRLQRDGAFGPWRSILLTHQAEGVHERLVETSGESIEVYFTTADDESEVEQVGIVPPPAVDRATILVQPPAYARPHVDPMDANLGAGLDERSVTPEASLVGSEVEMTFELNKPLPVPADPDEGWLTSTFHWPPDTPVEFIASEAGDVWTMRWRLEETMRLDLDLIDQHGLSNAEAISYRIEAVEDRPPSATITEPDSDQTVLASAVVDLAAEARDDVAVKRLSLEARVQPAGQSEIRDDIVWQAEQSADSRATSISHELDLSDLDLAEGDTVHLTAVAEDGYELDGDQHEPTRSATRRLRIISDLDLAGQLRRELSSVRRSAIRLEADQAELQDDLIEEGVQPGMARAQAELSDRIAAQQDVLDAIEQRMAGNRLDDEQLSDLMRQSGDLLDFAGQSASQAVESLEQREADVSDDVAAGNEPAAGDPQADPDAMDAGEIGPGEIDPGEIAPEGVDADAFDDLEARMPAPADQPVFDAQQEVRAELSDLIHLLDRDEDTWVVSRQLQELAEEQGDLHRDAAELADRTLGRDRDELDESELSELDRIALAQRELADDARQMIEDLRDRAAAMRPVDPQAADAMEAAADRAEREELDRDMDEAGDRIEQNQMRQGREAQEDARRTLDDMQRDIEEHSQAQVEELARRLSSLVESIERLVTVQENELIALARAVEEDDFDGRDRAMRRLNQNTTAVAAEAREAGQEARRIARALDRAAEAQGASVVALRARPIDVQRAEQTQERSLERLEEARDLAEQMQQAMAEQQLREQREELIDTYLDLRERQVALRDDANDLVADHADGGLGRRQMMDARRQANRQEAIRTELDDLRATTDEIRESALFNHIHRRMDAWAAEAAESLQGGEPDEYLLDRQDQVADALARIIDVLGEMMMPPDEFDEGDQAGGEAGGQGEQELIPDIAELRLLRSLQEQILEQTRAVDGRDDLTDSQRRQRIRQLSDEQQELMNLGELMLESLRQNQPMPGPGEGPGGGGDAGGESGTHEHSPSGDIQGSTT